MSLSYRDPLLDAIALTPFIPYYMRQIDNIVIHCTGGPQTQSADDIVRYHRTQLGWKAPGYHYIIERDGRIVCTQREDLVSNGVKGHNHDSINIAYVGGIDSKGRGIDNRTAPQKEALVRLLRELRTRYPKARILGHRDIASVDRNHNGIIDPWERVKECPCFDAIPEYKNI